MGHIWFQADFCILGQWNRRTCLASILALLEPDVHVLSVYLKLLQLPLLNVFDVQVPTTIALNYNYSVFMEYPACSMVSCTYKFKRSGADEPENNGLDLYQVYKSMFIVLHWQWSLSLRLLTSMSRVYHYWVHPSLQDYIHRWQSEFLVRTTPPDLHS